MNGGRYDTAQICYVLQVYYRKVRHLRLHHSKGTDTKDEKMYTLVCEVTLNKGYHINSCSRCTNFMHKR